MLNPFKNEKTSRFRWEARRKDAVFHRSPTVYGRWVETLVPYSRGYTVFS
jgi:hypothetical protein